MSRRSIRLRNKAALEAQENATLAAMPPPPPAATAAPTRGRRAATPPPKKAPKRKTTTAPKRKILKKAKQSVTDIIEGEDWERLKSDPTKVDFISLENYVNNENPSVREFSETIDHMGNTLHKDLVIPDVGEYVKKKFQPSPI